MNGWSSFHLPEGLAGLTLHHLVYVFPTWPHLVCVESGLIFFWAGIYAGVDTDLQRYCVQPKSGKNNVSRYFLKQNRNNPFLMDRELP